MRLNRFRNRFFYFLLSPGFFLRLPSWLHRPLFVPGAAPGFYGELLPSSLLLVPLRALCLAFYGSFDHPQRSLSDVSISHSDLSFSGSHISVRQAVVFESDGLIDQFHHILNTQPLNEHHQALVFYMDVNVSFVQFLHIFSSSASWIIWSVLLIVTFTVSSSSWRITAATNPTRNFIFTLFVHGLRSILDPS